MKIRSTLAAAFALGVVCTPLRSAEPAPPEAGRWITESGNLEVEIAACGDALCGTVVRVLANRSMSKPGEAMQAADDRPVLGMKLLSGLRRSGDDALAGEIHDRENAKTYRVRLTLDGPRQLLVRPYVGMPLFGKTQLWRRAQAVGAEVQP